MLRQIKQTSLFLLLIANSLFSQVNIIPASEFDQYKLDSSVSLSGFLICDDYDALIINAGLNSELVKNCQTEMFGTSCTYSGTSIKMATFQDELIYLYLKDSSHHISINNTTVKVGDSINVLQNLYPNAFGNQEIMRVGYEDAEKNGLRFSIGNKDSITSLIFLFDSNNKIYSIQVYQQLV